VSDPLGLPAGYGQVVYDGYRKRARAGVGDDVLPFEWAELDSGHQACWDGAAADLAAYLDRVPR
jgi:hypothetical protein